MNLETIPLLSFLIFFPLVGAIATGRTRNHLNAKKIALGFATIELLVSLLVCVCFNPANDAFQFVERHRWITSLGVDYLIGVDGLSVLFLPMSAFVTLMAILASWNSIQHMQAFHYALLLTLEGITIGVFTALDLVLFFLFWELTLPPIFFLIGLWGVGPHRRTAAVKYTLFMLFGGAALLLGIVILALKSAPTEATDAQTVLIFNLPQLLENPLPDEFQGIVFVLLLLAFAVKTPLFPFHTWMPSVTMEGSPQVAALLTGLKLGAYGIMRFAMTLAPSAAVEYSWLLGVLGAITLIYGALNALYQANFRRLLAYASISHVGLVIIGISALNMQGIQGAVFQLFNFTIAASSLMLIAGAIQHRLGSTECIHLGGLAKVMPKLTCFYFIFVFSSIGVPGTNGFPAELLLIISALKAHPSLGIAALVAAVLGAAYMIDFSRKAFFGPITQQTVRQCQDLRRREFLMLCCPALLVFIFGLFPNIILHTNEKSAEKWLTWILEQPIVKSDEVAKSDFLK